MSEMEYHVTGLASVFLGPGIGGAAAFFVKQLWSEGAVFVSVILFIACVLCIVVYGYAVFQKRDKRYDPHYHEHNRKMNIFNWWGRIAVVFTTPAFLLVMLFG